MKLIEIYAKNRIYIYYDGTIYLILNCNKGRCSAKFIKNISIQNNE